LTSPDRWRQVERLYHDALARAEGERAAFLRLACAGDDALQREVESLLNYAAGAQGFMEASAIEVVAAMTPSDDIPRPLIGQRLGPYEIGPLLGAGGMGEVYRARDSKLGREVAIKILPDVFIADADRRARFEREARLLAALNHPHIGAIYGFEDRDGLHGLVLELVEGETLAERLARSKDRALPESGRGLPSEPGSPTRQPRWGGDRPMAITETLTIARQIAAALDAAHEKGIVHRDLKPDNIAITPEGVVKVLDFGLAKSGEPADSTEQPTNAGVVLGTAAYMSPEQARGKPVDKRTDIWAFGCVLYQMLTGRKPFAGDTASDTMVAILDREPDWSALPETTPPTIRRLLKRCLEKDPKRRLRDIGDAQFDLDDQAPEPVSSSNAPRRETAALAAAAVCVIGALAIAGYALSRAPARPRLARFHVLPPVEGSINSVALSADGRSLAYVGMGADGQRRLWVRPVDSLEARLLAGTEGASWPFWSPDGRFIAFFAQGKLRKIAAAGGASQPLCDAEGGTGGTWSPAGAILFAPVADGGLYQVSADGGSPSRVTTPRAGQGGHRFPQFLPDGRRFLFLARAGQGAQSGIHVGSLDSPETALLLETDTRALYAPPGHLLFIRGNALMAQAFDTTAARLSGEVMSIAEDVAYDAGGGSTDVAVTEGLLVYRPRDRNVRELAWVDRAGRQLGDAGPAADYIHPWLSPDEKRAVVEVVDPDTGAHAVWMLDLVRGARLRFVAGPAASHWPIWSADGRRILFSSDRSGPWSLFARTSTGAGADEELLRLPTTSNPTDWSRDGRFVIYQTSAAATRSDIWALPVTPPGRPFAVATSAAAERQAQLSPDGRWVAYVADDSGRDEVFVQGFPVATDKWPVSSAGGSQPQWRRDGRELFYLSMDLNLMAVAVNATASSFDAGVPSALFAVTDLRRSEISARNNFMPSADGKRFLINRPVIGRGFRPIAVVVDWATAVRKQ
jgi:serine/threonine protein kinase/Tol biopolymer transport system component